MLGAFLKLLNECKSVYMSESAIITVFVSYPVCLRVKLPYGRTGISIVCVCVCVCVCSSGKGSDHDPVYMLLGE